MTESRRGVVARLGICALNLLLPGLGLLRLGRARAACAVLALYVGANIAFLAFYALTRRLTFALYASAAALLIIGVATCFIGAIWMSWRHSRARAEEPLPWWSRWYALATWTALGLLASWPLPDLMHHFYKVFYIPAESMTPTFDRNDRIVASMRGAEPLRRGDVIMLKVGGSTYIKRVAALPGDRIAFKAGVVILNGRRIEQRLVRTESVSSGEVARRLAERFPGEDADHEIYDLGPTDVDDMPERRIAPNHVFVLGDNRDRSADSRVPRKQLGVDLLPVGDVLGRPLFFTWPRSKMGKSADH